MSWSKAEVARNIPAMVVTPEVSHAPMSWLKAEAPRNIPSILVTPEVSHAPMSSLKDESANNSNMSVTPACVEMWSRRLGGGAVLYPGSDCRADAYVA